MLADSPLTKRQLGWLCLGVGVALGAAALGVDLLRAGQFSGIGVLQQRLLGAAGLLAAVGLSLLPLGDRPA